MRISNFLTSLQKRNPLLYAFGLAHLGLFTICLLLFFYDDTVVSGINAWIKPMKFSLSITIYLFTFAWCLNYLKSERSKKIISWVVLITMLVEIIIIVYQASRGERSHFNITSLTNAILFSTMGVFIGINTLINLFTLILFLIPNQTNIKGNSLLAWQFGLSLFFLGSISGGIMSSQLAHSIGMADGGAGLPFLNWNTLAGDVRVPHFFTLHGLQFIPLTQYFIIKDKPKSFLFIFALLYLFFCVYLHQQALSGIPFIKIN
ncbi:MAG: hypothetical protein MUF68_04375 [Cyclobacteriaceae bacterium]|jgi:hypothetical protein|nr:hypothetical protein [Cyclobacteriaceae bacterium]